jgi:hypothetical protein
MFSERENQTVILNGKRTLPDEKYPRRALTRAPRKVADRSTQLQALPAIRKSREKKRGGL